jgi:hypothetical protein
MRQKPGTKQSHGEEVVKDIRRATHMSLPLLNWSASMVRKRRIKVGNQTTDAGSDYGDHP